MAIETLGAALRQINRLFTDGVVAGLSDAQLLERFLSHGDAGSFEALLGRHGPMVLSVCRGILRDPHDAEDAFQATFLVLVKTGGTIRGGDALGGWLHRVARRVANQANGAAARRRRLERQVGQMAVATSTNGPASSDDLLPALHEEIDRLPEKYRVAVICCDLEGMTQAQAAGQLHWGRRTLQHRLAEGRARLRRRLARRGLAPDGAALGAVLLREARAAVPAAWNEATVRAAVAVVNPTITVWAVSLAARQLVQEVFKVMLLQKLTLASLTLLAAGLIAWGASAALVSLQDGPSEHSQAQLSDRLREMVLLALRANDQRLGAVQLDIEDVLEDLTVAKREETVFKPDKDTIVITVREPRRVSLSRVRIFGDRLLRYDYLDPPGVVTKALSFDGSLWTELKELGPNTQVIIRRPDQMASIAPLDPRQIAVFDVRERLSEVLARSAFSERTAGPSGKPRLIRAETKVARGFGRTVISFDPTFGLLPVEIITYYSDAAVAQHTRVHYRKVEARDAWVLDHAVTHAYGKSGALPHKRWTKRVKDLKLLERHDDALFEIDRPPSYLLHDLTKDSNNKPLTIGR